MRRIPYPFLANQEKKSSNHIINDGFCIVGTHQGNFNLMQNFPEICLTILTTGSSRFEKSTSHFDNADEFTARNVHAST